MNRWLPTAENINALPAPVKAYIHDLIAQTDHAGMVAENVFLKDQVRQLEHKLEATKNAYEAAYDGMIDAQSK